MVALSGLLAVLAAFELLAVGPTARPSPAREIKFAEQDSTLTSTVASAERRKQRAEQLARLGVDCWHAAGYRGRGVKVAILDSGFRGYRAHLGKALPAQIQVRSFRNDGNLEARDSQHGILCGEVVHALAPEAELLFANWEPDHVGPFLNAVRWARRQGAQIISCSMIFPSWSDGEGGGQVHEQLAQILGSGSQAGDLLCFASAGNIAQRHWAGVFRAGEDGFHEWQPGETINRLSPRGGENVGVELYWQPGADYDLFVSDGDTDQEVGRSTAGRGVARSSAVVCFQPVAGHTYQVRVRQAWGSARRFHHVSLNAGLSCSTRQGSIPFPADGPEVVTVGAVDYEGRRHAYSSCGPNSSQPKPDVVAPVPFPSLWRSKPFAGTSAAAPQAAALAALWWSRYPDWRATGIREALRTSACDLGPPGYDCETGYGRINLPQLDGGPSLTGGIAGIVEKKVTADKKRQ
jgi:subtilisin family serine protease